MIIVMRYVFSEPDTGRLFYRRQFPAPLRPFIPGKPQGVKRTLGGRTLSAPGAAQRLTDAQAEYDRLLTQAHKMASGKYDPLDPPLIAYLASLYAHGVEEDDERGRKGLSVTPRPYETRRDPEDDWLQSREMLETFDRPGILAHWADWTSGYTRALRYAFDRDSEAFGDLCEAMAKAACETWLVLDQRIDPEMPRAAPTREAPQLPNAAQRSLGEPLPLSPLFAEYAKRQAMTVGVRSEYEGFIRLLIERLGHDDARRLTAADLRAWRDAMLDSPSKRGVPLDPRTVHKRIGVFKSLLGWAEGEGKLPANVASGVTVKIPAKAKLREKAFTSDEARTILMATLAPVEGRLTAGHRLARRWVPWLMAYSGARVNELSQMRKEDVRQIEGIWAINITPDAGDVKAKEARLVPLHSHLIDQGFLTMLETMPDGPLFYDPALQRTPGEGNRHVKKVGERLAAWVKNDLGIMGVQPNHGWRHLFKTLATDHEVPARVSDAIVGHAPRTAGEGYGNVSLKAKLAAIERIPAFRAVWR